MVQLALLGRYSPEFNFLSALGEYVGLSLYLQECKVTGEKPDQDTLAAISVARVKMGIFGGAI